MAKINPFQDLRIWQESHNLCLEIYKITRGFLREEFYVLTSQLRRSATLVLANIAEGMGRNTTKDFIHFLFNARGSIQETIYHLMLAKDLQYSDIEEFEILKNRYNGLGAAVNIFISKLK